MFLDFLPYKLIWPIRVFLAS